MNKYLKRILPFLIILLLAWFLVRRGLDWGELQIVLHQARWGWLALALAWQAGTFGAVTWLNEILLQRYSIKIPYAKQYFVQLAMAFVETVVPSASVSGLMLRARLLKPHGVSADVSTATTLAETALISASVVLVALPMAGIAILNGIKGFSILGDGLFVIVGVAILTGVVIWHWDAPRFAQFRLKLLHVTIRIWERTIQPRWPQYFSEWSVQRVTERVRYLWAETMASLHVRPYSILISLVARFSFDALCFSMCFYAMGQSLPPATLILLYALSIAVNTIGAILLGGVGLAEISLSALYAQFGVQAEAAVAIALAYRLAGYWFPRAVGGVAFLWFERKNLLRPISETTS